MSGLVYFGSGSGGTGDDVKFLHADIGGNVAPDGLGVVNINSGSNIAPTVGTPNTITISVTDSIHLPNTNATGTEGALWLGAAPGTGVGGTIFLHNHGTNNTFLGIGANSGLTDSGGGNVAAGANALRVLTSGSNNSALGFNSLYNNDSGGSNCAIGQGSLFNNVDGVRNVALGVNAGAANSVDAHDNINIGNGGSAGINNRTTIGTVFSGGAGQNEFYAHGIYQVAPTATSENVIIDSTGKLGTSGPESGKYGFMAYMISPITLPWGTGIFAAGRDWTPDILYNPDSAFVPRVFPAQSYYEVKKTGLYSFYFNLELNAVNQLNGFGSCYQSIHNYHGPTPRHNQWKVWSPWYVSGAGLQSAEPGNASNAINTYMYCYEGNWIEFTFYFFVESIVDPLPTTFIVAKGTTIGAYLIHT